MTARYLVGLLQARTVSGSRRQPRVGCAAPAGATASTNPVAPDGAATSSGTATTSAPVRRSCSAAASNLSASRAQTASFAPSSANERAMAKPSPRLAPVTAATFADQLGGQAATVREFVL